MTNRKLPILNDTFDPIVFFKIVKKTILPSIAILLIALGIGFVYLRYTPPLYEAKTVMQMTNDDNPNKLLKLSEAYGEDNKNLNKIITLLRSKEFIKRCMTHLAFDVRYFIKGTFLNSELYKSTPFIVEYKIESNNIYQKNVFVHFYSIDSCQVRYESNGSEYEYKGLTGKWFSLGGNQFKIIMQNFQAVENMSKSEPLNMYFFQITNPREIENEILEKLSVRILSQQTQTIEITYSSNNASQAAEVVNVITDVFQKYEVVKKGESVQNILKFIDKQLDIVYNNLDIVESDMHSFKKKFNINDKPKSESPIPLFVSRATEMENEILSVEFELSTLEHIKTELSDNPDANIYEMLAMLTGTKIESFISTMLSNLQLLIQQRNNMLYEVTSTNPRITKIETQIASYKRQLLDFIGSSITRLEQKKNILQEEIIKYEKSIFRGSGYNEFEYAKLQRLYSINEEFYHQLMQKKAEYMISQASFVPSSTVLEVASVPTNPISPNKTRVFSIILTVALITIFVLVTTKYLLYDDILLPETIKNYTDTPIIGVIPNYKNKVPVSQLLVDKHPNSMFTEAFRNIRTNIQFLSQGHGTKLITVTSTISGEGKTFVAINLAGIQALSGKKVILLDMDLRKPRLHIGFDVDNEKGMSTIICGEHKWQKCVRKSDLNGLDYITAGPVPPNPAELAFSNRVEEIFEELEDHYDVIIVDTPPIGIVTDALMNLHRANYPIYVFKAGVSKRSFIQNVNSLIEDKKLSNISIVFNGVDFRKSRITAYGYGYGYGYGYNYYTDEEDYVSSKWLKRFKSAKFW